MLASMAHVEPLPLVPATSAILIFRSGAVARSSNARVRPSFHCSSGLARGFQPTPRSWSARLYNQASAACSTRRPRLRGWDQEQERVGAEHHADQAQAATREEQ